MKKKLLLCVVFFTGVNLFSQNLNERIFIVNPNKGIFLQTLRETRELEATQDLLDNNSLIIRFGIYDDSENLVFFMDANNFMDPFNSPFSKFRINIPAFDWHGQFINEYSLIRRTTRSTVPDGEYILKVSIQKENSEGNDKGIINLSTYRIFVDTTPPDFELALITVPFLEENQKGDLEKYLIYMRGEKADTLKLEIYGIKTGQNYYSETYMEKNELIMLEFEPKQEDCIVTALAVDEAENESTRTIELSAQSYMRIETSKKQQAAIDELQAIIAELMEKDNKFDEPIQKLKLSDIKTIAGEQYPYLDVPDIVFPGNKASIILLQDLIENIIKINNVVNMVLPFIDEFSFLHIHGFGNPLNYNADDNARETEEIEQLRPLSLQRAEFIKNIIVLIGFPEEKIKIEGMGGTVIRADPLDSKENWHNRIVRFYIE